MSSFEAEPADMMSDRVWKRLAEVDPYWSVLSLDKFHGELSEERRAEFFSLGEGAIDHIIGRATNLQPGLGRKVAIDFGCGVGRLTRALASRFERVFALDISERMLELCAKNVAGIGRVQPILSDDELSGIRGLKADLIVSSITFQHIRPSRGLGLIQRLFQCLKPDGVLMVFVLVSGSSVQGSQAVDTDEINHSAESFIEMNVYPIDRIVEIASEFSAELRMDLVPTGGQLGADVYVARTKG